VRGESTTKRKRMKEKENKRIGGLKRKKGRKKVNRKGRRLGGIKS
jgi:hypothetical protein